MLPERPLEPVDAQTNVGYVAATGHEDEKALLKEFVRDRFDLFIEYIENYDSTLFWDFADIERWEWNKYKEENRIA